MASNYPPGVTGGEPEITGEYPTHTTVYMPSYTTNGKETKLRGWSWLCHDCNAGGAMYGDAEQAVIAAASAHGETPL